MHSIAKAHRPCFTITSTAAHGNTGHPFNYAVSMTSGDEGEVLLGSCSTLRDAVKTLEAVETVVDTVLDLLARQGALIAPPKVEPAFQPGESYLGKGHQMTHAEAAEAGRMGMAAVSGLDAATMRVPGLDDPDPAVHAAVREAMDRLPQSEDGLLALLRREKAKLQPAETLLVDQASFEREALQDQAATPGFPMAPMQPLGQERLDELTS